MAPTMCRLKWTFTVVFVLITLTPSTESNTIVSFDDKDEDDGSVEGVPVVQYNGESGAICASGLTEDDARVLCRQYGWDEEVSVESSVATGSRVIRLRSLSCTKSLSNVYDCSGFSWGDYTSQCSGQRVARLKCYKYIHRPSGFNWRILQYIGYGLVPVIVVISIAIRYHYTKKYRQQQAARGTVGAIPGQQYPGQQYPGQAPLQAGSAPPPPPGTLSTAAPMSSSTFGPSVSEGVPPPPSYTSVMNPTNTLYPPNKLPPIGTTGNIPTNNTFSTMDNYRTDFSRH